MYIFSQVICGVGMALDFIGKTMKRKLFIILFIALANSCYALSYIFLHKASPAIANGIYLIRGVWYFLLESKNKPQKSYILPIVVLLGGYLVPFVLLWESYFDLFVLTATVIMTIGLAFKNTLLVRLMLILTSVCWSVYNFHAHGYVNFANDLITIITLIVAIIIYNVIPYKKSKKEKVLENNEEIKE